MAQGEVIKSFLVGLGFDVDESSLAAFNKSIQTSALRVTALYGAVNAFAGSMVYAFAKISEGFEQMGYEYHIIAPAINKAIILRQELLKAYSSAGINIRKVIVDSIKLNLSLTKTKFAMEAIYKSVGSKFFGLLQKQSDAFRKRLYENMPYIIHALETLVNVVFKAFDGVTRLGGRLWSILTRVYDFFLALDKATNGWSTVILGVVAAWKLLNLSFIATPLGLLLTGFLTLLTLFDDFKTYKEGGLSLINWGSDSVKQIVGVVAVAGSLLAVIEAIVLATKAWALAQAGINGLMAAFSAIASANPIGLLVIAVTALVGLLDILDTKWNLFGGHVAAFFSSLGGRVLDFIGGATGLGAAANIGSAPALGSTSNHTNNNVNAKFQTDINVIGSPNADATARATAGAQQNVNRDAVQNLKRRTF